MTPCYQLPPSAKVKQVTVKSGGQRWVLNLPVPKWAWEIPKDLRPREAKISKQDGYGWQLSIWGDSEDEVFGVWDALNVLGGQFAKEEAR